ncbi:hypothetical protein [Mycoavidus sp. SF9855]|uniref:AbrB/MazE/SpoVT family DNA-binding domain-containing protein n=1 Tax=Mycoavidus sp. SF9855 TaxID=2968475 RepID=UPI00211CA24A|nr:hypothetical protein [Mycoavidus sp. SF9855]UUM22225.1 hypothetical protein NQD60_03905 [Mycoavidus sp. SF9855]
MMTIPGSVLKMLNVEADAQLEIDVVQGAFTAKPISKHLRKRYSLHELLRRATLEPLEEAFSVHMTHLYI